MARTDELYNAIYNYCEENKCWKAWMTAKDWNACLGENYGVACFTALVNAGKIEKDKRYGDKSYSYRIVPTGAVKEMMEEEKRKKEIKSAEWTIKNHDETVARIKARYEEAIRQAEEAIRQAEEQLKYNLAYAQKQLEEAKALLDN